MGLPSLERALTVSPGSTGTSTPSMVTVNPRSLWACSGVAAAATMTSPSSDADTIRRIDAANAGFGAPADLTVEIAKARRPQSGEMRMDDPSPNRAYPTDAHRAWPSTAGQRPTRPTSAAPGIGPAGTARAARYTAHPRTGQRRCCAPG